MSDATKTSTCYMCACRCGIRVHLKSGKIRYIEGNPDHPVNKGVLCAKGAAGIMQHYSPARLSKPLLRVGERGSGEFKEIEWEEALTLAAGWLNDIRQTDAKRLAFFTDRDQSQSLTGWWAQQFGTLNYAAHGGFCSVNMAAGGLYTIGGSFWEFGEPDWELTRYFLMFGVAEDHDSNPIKIGLGKLKSRGDAKFVSVNPIRTGYSAIADEWVGIRPGTDGLFVFALIHELLKAEQVDWDYLARYTNASWLVYQDPGGSDDGLFARDVYSGDPLCFDRAANAPQVATGTGIKPAFVGEFTIDDGRKVVPVFQLLAERYLDPQYAPDSVAARIGVPAAQIKRIAAEIAEVAFQQTVEIDVAWTDWAGRRHDKMIGRPVSMHAMRGISAHANGFHTCRAIHLLQVLIGSIDVPGGFRHKPPFPKHIPPAQKPAGKNAEQGAPLASLPLGFPSSPEDLLIDDGGAPLRIDKAFSWEHPLAIHGMLHMVIHNAWKADPYPIDTLFLYMTNLAWNSSMNIPDTLKYLTDKAADTGEYKIPHIIYSDAYYSETVPYADLVLPDTTYLERWDCISLLDRPISDADGPADAIRQPVLEPDRDVRSFQTVLLDLGARLKLPGMAETDGTPCYPGGYADYLVNHLRTATIGPLAGWRGAAGDESFTGAVNPEQLTRYVENGCFWRHEFAPAERYFKFANRAYLDFARRAGWIGRAEPVVMQLYSEALQKFRLAAQTGLEMPAADRKRIQAYCDPLPIWYESVDGSARGDDQYPLHALTQRPMHMYHSWGSQNAWLRQITNVNHLYMHDNLADRLGLADDDWAWVSSADGKVRVQIKRVTGVNTNTVWTWNAIGKRAGAWGLDDKAPESTQGFLLNHVISELLPAGEGNHRYSNSDPVTGQAAWFDLRVNVERCATQELGLTQPRFTELKKVQATTELPAILRYGKDIQDAPTTQIPAHREFIGNRHEAAMNIAGLPDGHGNQLEAEKRDA